MKKLILCALAFSILLGVNFASGAILDLGTDDSYNPAPIVGVIAKGHNSIIGAMLNPNYQNSSGTIAFFGLQTRSTNLPGKINFAGVQAKKGAKIQTETAGTEIGKTAHETSQTGKSNSTNPIETATPITAPIQTQAPVSISAPTPITPEPEETVSLRVFARDSNENIILGFAATASKAAAPGQNIAITYTPNGTNYPGDFRSMPKGNYRISVTKPGYDTNIHDISLTKDSNATIYLTTASAPPTNPEIPEVLDQNVSLMVFVRDSNGGSLIPGFAVTASKSAGPGQNFAITYRPGGTNYPGDFRSMPKGEYQLRASKNNDENNLYDTNTLSISLAEDSNITIYLTRTPAPVTETPAASGENVSLRVFVKGSDQENLIGGFTVTAIKTQGLIQPISAYGPVGTNYPGDFRPIPKGNYLLTATKNGYSPGFRNIILAADSNETISLAALPQSQGRDIPLEVPDVPLNENVSAENAFLRVFVTGPDQGSLISGFTVTAIKTQGLIQSLSVYNPNGTNYPGDFASMPKGNYLLLVTRSGYSPGIKSISLAEDSNETIVLSAQT